MVGMGLTHFKVCFWYNGLIFSRRAVAQMSTVSVLGIKEVLKKKKQEVLKDQKVVLPHSQDHKSFMPHPCGTLEINQPLGIYVLKTVHAG